VDAPPRQGDAEQDKDALYRVAYEEATRARSEQLALIDSFRARAGLLLSAAAITTSFLGAQALGGGSWGWPSWVALGSFVGVANLSLAILWPRAHELSTSAEQIMMNFIEAEEPAPLRDLHRDLTLQVQQSYSAI
jgi:hypothetical protein